MSNESLRTQKRGTPSKLQDTCETRESRPPNSLTSTLPYKTVKKKRHNGRSHQGNIESPVGSNPISKKGESESRTNESSPAQRKFSDQNDRRGPLLNVASVSYGNYCAMNIVDAKVCPPRENESAKNDLITSVSAHNNLLQMNIFKGSKSSQANAMASSHQRSSSKQISNESIGATPMNQRYTFNPSGTTSQFNQKVASSICESDKQGEPIKCSQGVRL